MNPAFRIVPIAEEHIEDFRAGLDSVARERRYLLFLEAPSLEDVSKFLRNNILPIDRPTRARSGVLGIAVAEVSVHEAEKDGVHELFLMCDDVKTFVADMGKRSIACSVVKDQGWGLLTQVTLPGGATLGVYQPRHARPKM